MTVIISDFVEAQLDAICRYYREVGYPDCGLKIRENIIRRAYSLTTFPKIGKIDEDDLGEYAYRYFIEGVHRVYYRINPENDTIIVVFLFDTRQNPDRLVEEFPE